MVAQDARVVTSAASLGNAEAHFDRPARLTLALIAVFCLVVLSTTLYVLTGPVDGWRIPYSVPDPPPLEYFAGDWVIAVNGIPAAIDAGVAPQQVPAGWRVGGTVRYTIERKGRQMELAIVLHRFDTRGVVRSLWHTMTDTPLELSWSLIAILVFILRPRNPAAQLLLLAGVAHTAVTKFGWAATMIGRDFTPAPIYYSYQVTASFWGYLFFPSIIMLALSFPRRIFPLSRRPRAIPALLYGLGLVLTLLMFVTNNTDILTVVLVSEAVLIVLAYVLALINARRLRDDPVMRAQTLWFVFGFALSIVPLPIAYLLTYRGILNPGLFPLFANSLTTLALPVCLAVAITRYHLFDIDVIINRTLVYVPLTTIVAGIFAVVISLSQKAFVALTGQESLASTMVATLIVVAVFNPIRERVQRTVDKAFKEAPSSTKRLNAFQEQVRSRVSQVDVRPIIRRFLEEAVAAFDAEGGAAYVEEQGSLRQVYTAGEWKDEEKISVPVEPAETRIACIALGKRCNGRDYTSPDRQMLEQPAQVVGQAIEEDGGLHLAHYPQSVTGLLDNT